jgi:hypothetical protein
MSFRRSLFYCLAGVGLLTALVASAQDFSSTDYTVTAPVMFPGGYGTSTDFGLIGVVSQIATGTSTASSENLFGGFLYFPFVSTPVISATPGDGQVSLLWTSANASVGWAVSGYTLGQSTVSGGPYAYTFVGNTLTHTSTGLSDATPYYFIVRVIDVLGNYIATSTEVSATPVASGGGGGGGSGAGGAGGGGTTYSSSSTGVKFSGRAYPGSTVTLLQDAQVVITTVAGPDSEFQMTLTGLSAGNYSFSLYSQDSQGNRSSLLTFPIGLTTGAVTNVTGIFIAPTNSVDKSEVKQGDTITIFGQTVASSTVTIQVNSDQAEFASTTADKGGVYLYNFDTSALDYGDHSTKSKSSINGQISPYGAAAAFSVGDQDVLAAAPVKHSIVGDVNGDGKVNLVDFSVVAYWFGRSGAPKTADLNGDGKVNLVDFSILAYHWTG